MPTTFLSASMPVTDPGPAAVATTATPRRAKRCAGAIATVVMALAAWPVVAQVPQDLPTTRLKAGIHNIRAQVAQTEEQRTIGLMHRPTMPTNDGMLFIFPQATTQCFWMKNTLLPLSAAFVEDDGTVVNIEEMKPRTLDTHCSTKPVRYVLEMNKGWFSTRGIRAGDRLSGDVFKR